MWIQHLKEKSVWEIFDFQCIYLTKLEYRPSLESPQTLIMIRDERLCVDVLIPASQIPILVTALGILYFSSSGQKSKLAWTISYSNKALMNIHHDSPNSHVPGINLLEFLVDALSITSYHSESAKNVCKSHTVSVEKYLYLLVSNTWFDYWQKFSWNIILIWKYIRLKLV